MMGSQFHPEFKSRPDRPHPMFYAFVGACVERYQQCGGAQQKES